MNIIIGKSGFLTKALCKFNPMEFNSSQCYSMQNCNAKDLIKKIQDSEGLDKESTIIFAGWPTSLKYDDYAHIEFWQSKGKNIMKAINESFPNQRLMTWGSCLEYGLIEGKLATEDLCVPCTKLGTAKLMMYRDCMQIFETKYTHLRIFYPYDMEKPRKYTFLWYLKNAVDNMEEEFEMSIGTQRRDFFNLNIFSEQVSTIIRKKSFSNAVYNIGNGYSTSVLDLANKYLRYRNYDMKLITGKMSVPWYEPEEFYAKIEQ